MRMPAVVQKITERRGEQRFENDVEIGKVTGQPAGKKKHPPARALLLQIAFVGKAAVYEFPNGETYSRVCKIIHAGILTQLE